MSKNAREIILACNLLRKAIYMCISCLFGDNFLLKLKIIIDRAIGAPDHGKDVVGGLNARYKSYLRR